MLPRMSKLLARSLSYMFVSFCLMGHSLVAFADEKKAGPIPIYSSSVDMKNATTYGLLSDKEKIDYLKKVGASKKAKDKANRLKIQPQVLFMDEQPPQACEKSDAYDYLGMAIGFVKDWQDTDPVQLPIVYPGFIKSDDLKNKKVKITFQDLRIVNYPGYGEHQITFEFFLNAQGSTDKDFHWSQAYRANDDEGVAVINKPIFLKYTVSDAGLIFHGYTVNVKSKANTEIMKFLNGEEAKRGISLASAANPAIGPLLGVGKAVAENFLSQSENKQVQFYDLGLDFKDNSPGLRLAKGLYVIAQVPKTIALDWNDWVYDRKFGTILKSKTVERKMLPCNYVSFSITSDD